MVVYANSVGIWADSGCKDGDSVKVTMNEKGKYLSLQESLDLQYSTAWEDYADVETFCNFRACSGGELRENAFFRGTSPLDDYYGRAAATDLLLSENGVRCVLDLADNEEKMEAYLEGDDSLSSYSKELYRDGDVILAGLSSAYRTETYGNRLVEGLRELMGLQGPWYIHCQEGKDRTGFVCLLLEALCGASYEELEADYMKSYENYYGITKEKDPEAYELIREIKLNDMTEWLAGLAGETGKASSYEEGARAYLIMNGMSEAEVDQLRAFLTGK